MIAVAYSQGPTRSEPKIIQHWPPKMINELANKVPTTLQYASNSGVAERWGFLCDEDSEGLETVECFKLHLDAAYRRDRRSNAPTLQQARKWYEDYLRCLHDYLAEMILGFNPEWRSQKAEFIFSVPTTWKNPGMIAETKKTIENAGFGSDGAGHRVSIGLTEAEAAAVSALTQQYQKDDVVLVCDAGGGTTDVNVLRLASSKLEPTRLEQLSWVDGRPIGSTSIDMAFHGILENRLSYLRDYLPADPAIVAHQMMHGRFERFKCSYGTALSNTIPTLPLRIPGLPPGLNFPDLNIENSEMIFSR